MTDFVATCTHDAFEPLVGEVFSLAAFEDDADAIEITLFQVKLSKSEAVRDIPMIADGTEIPPRRAFSLAFKGPVDRGFMQGLFRVSHPKTGEMALMLTCFGADPDARLYEAVFF